MKRVLVADDASFMRQMIRDIIEPEGYEVVGEASDGVEVVEKFKELQPDMVMMDIVMPKRSGIDAVKAICLGADAAAFGTANIIAGGCIACMQCHVGQCVTGIATQDPAHEGRYKPDLEAQNI